MRSCTSPMWAASSSTSATADEVAGAFEELRSRVCSRRTARLKVEVQRMIAGGRETILGMTRDPQFGPVLMFGLGGIFVEVMKDVSVRIHPLTDVDARAMIERIKGFPLLAGARGEKPVDLAFLEESLLRLSQLVGDLEDELAEIDVNPLIVTGEPQELVRRGRQDRASAGSSRSDLGGRRPVSSRCGARLRALSC